MTNTFLPGYQAFKPLAEAWINLHGNRRYQTPAGHMTKRTELALAKFHGAMEMTEAVTGVDRTDFVNGFFYESIYTGACCDDQVRTSEIPLVLATAIRGLVSDAIEIA